MKDNQNLTLGVLIITAVILLVGVILGGNSSSNTAMAIGQLDRGGDYIMVTAQFTQNDEVIYITDAAAQMMNLYSYDATQRQLVLWDQVDLKRVLAANVP
jgi:hypothetical protein